VASSADRLELLHVADAVAREKGIDRRVLLSAVEGAIEKAARANHGLEADIKVEIDHKTGELSIRRALQVVEELVNPSTQILLSDARRKDRNVQVGDILMDSLPPMRFGRIAAQAAKQVIVQKVREAERDRQYEEFKGRVGEIVNGFVKAIEYGHVIVDLNRGEGIIRRDQLIPREVFRVGDRVRSYIGEVKREPRGPQVFLSRTHPQFVAKLFSQEVTEVYDGVVEIKSIARDPGSQAKVAVVSRDSSIDPVGACVGIRGSRVQAVAQELQGEKIDIIPWSADVATFLVNALRPAEVSKVVLDEGTERIEVIVPEDQLSIAIGRRGQNVRLASQLTGWGMDIFTEEEDSKRRVQEFNNRTDLFMQALDVDEMVAQLLATEGFNSIEDLAYIEEAEIVNIEGFDEETASELRSRAVAHLETQNEAIDIERKELGIEDALAELPGITLPMLVTLGKSGIKTLEDLAGCDVGDLVGHTEEGSEASEAGYLSEFSMTEGEAGSVITEARKRVGWI